MAAGDRHRMHYSVRDFAAGDAGFPRDGERLGTPGEEQGVLAVRYQFADLYGRFGGDHDDAGADRGISAEHVEPEAQKLLRDPPDAGDAGADDFHRTGAADPVREERVPGFAVRMGDRNSRVPGADYGQRDDIFPGDVPDPVRRAALRGQGTLRRGEHHGGIEDQHIFPADDSLPADRADFGVLRVLYADLFRLRNADGDRGEGQDPADVPVRPVYELVPVRAGIHRGVCAADSGGDFLRV